ncbi:MAG: adenylate kinase [Planctomycetota bacterium]|nr:MAG: adenylate kinase [Planctomycetota bacterium]
MIVVLLGPPGVGKGTQAERAAARFGWRHLSTGELLRDEVVRGTPLGQQANVYMLRGELVPDAVMVDMVAEALANVPEDAMVLLDGFPRTLPQAQALAAKAPGGGIRLALYFHAPDAVLVQRLLGRGRPDDTQEVVERRLAVYRQNTEPLVAHYRNLGMLRPIQADRPVDAIQNEMTAILQEALVAR